MAVKKVIATAVALAAMLSVLGCGRSEKTITVPGGKMKVTQKSRHGKVATVEFETKGGKAIVSNEKTTITEAELGAPVYPGATLQMSGKYEGSESSGTKKAEHYQLITKDSFDKVLAFYKPRLKDAKGSYVQSQGDQQMAMFQLGEKDEMTMHIIADPKKNETLIQVIKTEQ
jgi:hypothetical protein